MSPFARYLYPLIASFITLSSPFYAECQWRDITPGQAGISGEGTPAVVISPEGKIRLQGKTSPEDIAEIRDALGLPSGSYFGPEAFCGSLMSLLPSGFVQGLADIGSLFGLCPASSTVIKEAIEAYHQRAGRLCASFSGMQLSPDPNHNSVEIWDCNYTAPKIEPNCEALSQFCRKTIQPELWLFKEGATEGFIAGSATFPGCSCTVATLSWDEISLMPVQSVVRKH